jgi:hypothetical protein
MVSRKATDMYIICAFYRRWGINSQLTEVDVCGTVDICQDM